MTLDATYFLKQPTKLVQSTPVGNGVSAYVAEQDTDVIDEGIEYYEPKFLEMVLGYDIAQEYITGIGEDTPAQKWVDLRDKLYDTTNKRSPVANYVFCRILNDSQTVVTRAGNVVGKSDESTVVSYYNKIQNAWNEMCPMVERLYDWLIENRETYEHDDLIMELDYNLTVKETML